jgi:hypothetical protein
MQAEHVVLYVEASVQENIESANRYTVYIKEPSIPKIIPSFESSGLTVHICKKAV